MPKKRILDSYMPKLVYDELAARYQEALLKHLNKFLGAKSALANVLIQTQPPHIEISAESEGSSFFSHLKHKLRVKEENFFDYKEGYLHDVMNRAICRKRPCTDRGEEIRDAVLWRSVLDIAKEAPEKTVIFISENAKQFASGDGTLHADLQQDCKEHGVNVKYFSSLDDFGKQHASKIDFITEDWLLGSIDIDVVMEEARDIITAYAERILARKLSDSSYPYDQECFPTGDSELTGYHYYDIESFYIYEMSDGALRIEATLIGQFEVRCGVEKRVRRKEYEDGFGYDSVFEEYKDIPFSGHRVEVKTENIYINPELSLNFEIIVRNETVVSCKVDE